VIDFMRLYKAFAGRPILNGVDLTVGKTGATYIIGSSGAGKSVLLRHAVGLLKPDSGTVIVAGTDITDLDEKALVLVRRRCGYVFQHSTLLDSLTVQENVALPLRSQLRLARSEALERAREHLEQMGLSAVKDRHPQELGAGIAKQVAICRSLTMQPEVLLFDEPTTGLDTEAARKIDRLIRHLCDDEGVCAVVVSHDRRSIFDIADHVAFLYKGRIHAEGTVKELLNSGEPVVTQFLEGRSHGPMEV